MPTRPQSWFTPFAIERAFWDSFDADYLFDLSGRLSAIGTFEVGFRPSGSKSGHRAAELILDEMRRPGLHDVHREVFPLHDSEQPSFGTLRMVPR